MKFKEFLNEVEGSKQSLTNMKKDILKISKKFSKPGKDNAKNASSAVEKIIDKYFDDLPRIARNDFYTLADYLYAPGFSDSSINFSDFTDTLDNLIKKANS